MLRGLIGGLFALFSIPVAMTFVRVTYLLWSVIRPLLGIPQPGFTAYAGNAGWPFPLVLNYPGFWMAVAVVFAGGFYLVRLMTFPM
jgi:hypothetical protein